jgi:tRNA dimethylallyltransferase
MSAPDQPVVVIAGPTASGKSQLALHLAREFAGTVINADSMQVYRDLAVLTARPHAAAMAAVPHRLYGMIDAAESCSVGRWRDLARGAIAEARVAGRTPLLVGGSGLYLSALLDGLAEVPAVAPEIVAAATALHARLGGASFRDALAALDPEAVRKLHSGDTQRLIRAYAVVTGTGAPLSEWQRRQRRDANPAAAAIILLPERAALYAAIDTRLAAMFDAGAIDEARVLVARGLTPNLPVMKAVGVREIAAFLRGESTREAALAAAQQATRRYAKRQFTWLRHRLTNGKKLRILEISQQFSERMLPEIFAFIRQFLLTAPK